MTHPLTPPRRLAELRSAGLVPDLSGYAPLVDGQPIPDGAPVDLVYAATTEALCSVPEADADWVDRAVQSARKTFDDGAWRTRSPSDRAAILHRVADAVLADAPVLARLHTLETGVPLAQAAGMHVPRTAENFRFFADLLSGLAGETYTQTGRYTSLVLREPIGVGGLIAPWNAPLVLSSMKAAACLALGNSLVIKPSEYAPLSVLHMARLMIEAGVPAGALQVVTGTGPVTGAALAAHPGIDALGFVGGTGTGRKIMAAAAGSLKKLGLELGGKSANLILKDADLERAVDGALLALYAGNGEQCLAGTRLLVERPVADAFTDQFVRRSSQLRLGDPFAAATEIGPLAFAAHFEKVAGYARLAEATNDARILTGGRAAADLAPGLFFEPTVVEVRDNGNRLCQEEVFGPFATLQVVDSVDEAIAVANASDYGLVAYVWSDHLPAVMQAAHGLKAGTVWVNTPMARDLRAPFGGYKQSGIGRDGLPGSIDLFTEEKTVMLPNAPLDLPRLGLGH